MEIDLNCDLGEGGVHDAELMPLITSANISCGWHAGDPSTALAALRLAGQHGVQAGAHPGFADREHFGRREHSFPAPVLFADCVYQLGALAGLALAAGSSLRYVKPHGALYNMACRDDAYAEPVTAAAEACKLKVMGLPNSRLQAACSGRVPFIAEGFADRRYQPDGSLVPRGRPDAFIEGADAAVRQMQWLIGDLGVETVCVHGDNPHAVEFVRALRDALLRQGFTIRAFA